MRQLCAKRIGFVGGGREKLAVVDAKLDQEIKLLAGGVDRVDNNKQNIQPKCSCNEFMGTSCVLICGNLIIMILSDALSPRKHRRRFDVQSETGRTAFNSVLISTGCDNAHQDVKKTKKTKRRGGSVFT